MPGNMKCGRLRFSNCFVVFFPFSQVLSPFTFLRSTESSFSSRRSLSFHRSCTLQHISPYIDSLVVPYFLFFLFSLFRSFFIFFFSFLISILPFLISSFLPCSILLLSSRLLHLFCFFVSFLRASLLIIRSIHTILSLYNLAFPYSLTF